MADTTAATNPSTPTPTTPPAAPVTPPADTKPAASQQPAEKTYTQAEVEALIQERLARVKAPATAAKPAEPVVAPAPQDNAVQEQLAAMQQVLIQAEVKAQMAMNGVQPEKVERACRLVDTKKCVGKEGQPDAEKIKAEIEALVKDFPELKATTAEGSAGFKIGADGTAQDKSKESTDAISRIFGNKK